MTNLSYFIVGYLVIFGLIGAYILHIAALKKRLRKEQEELSDYPQKD